jgi:hypothetical protein
MAFSTWEMNSAQSATLTSSKLRYHIQSISGHGQHWIVGLNTLYFVLTKTGQGYFDQVRQFGNPSQVRLWVADVEFDFRDAILAISTTTNDDRCIIVEPSWFAFSYRQAF